jgi:hypothetical protein
MIVIFFIVKYVNKFVQFTELLYICGVKEEGFYKEKSFIFI